MMPKPDVQKVTSNLSLDQINPMLEKPKTKFVTTNEPQHETVVELKNGAMKVNEAEAREASVLIRSESLPPVHK